MSVASLRPPQDCALKHLFSCTRYCRYRLFNSSSADILPRSFLTFYRRTHAGSSTTHALAVIADARRCKGDYGFNVFHNSNPQHGGSYARHERRMRDDEVEDFLRSVKGWVPVRGCDTSAQEMSSVKGIDSSSYVAEDAPPAESQVVFGEEAIKRTFTFLSYHEAYLFMGRVWAFCYGSDKYPHLTWEDRNITVYLYSPSFRGLSRREARVAAFLNDTYNMFKKSRIQQRKIMESVTKRAVVEQLIGEGVQKEIKGREARRAAPLQELKEGPQCWEKLVNLTIQKP
ncbi:unnamed protein product [Phytomonas sp. EM1]|nr:unnamed protein product [Phytomonas sp. EM1]|eukprot:CCW65241.1 unnamed protein product [Phytomonas sp. isolate EM1]